MVNKCELLRRISAYQFALYDLGLYQDSHPCDQRAQQLRQLYKEHLSRLINEYEQHYGRYVLTQQDVEESWSEWVAGPWPWETGKGDGRYVAI